MRDSIKSLIQTLTTALDCPDPVYEFGALQVPGQEGYADLRGYFHGKKFVGCDMRSGPGVDRLLDLHEIDLPDSSAGTVIAMDTLEHVESPHGACQEMFRILRPGGVLIVSSVMNFPIHDYPHDYWRFTPEAFRYLLRPFETSLVEALGQPEFPHTIVGVAVKGSLMESAQLRQAVARWKAQQEELERTSAARRVLKLILPPILVDLWRRLRS